MAFMSSMGPSRAAKLALCENRRCEGNLRLTPRASAFRRGRRRYYALNLCNRDLVDIEGGGEKHCAYKRGLYISGHLYETFL